MNDADMDALASATMSEGKCLRNVSRFVVGGREEHLTDVGALALAKAIGEGCMPKLQHLIIHFTGNKESAAAALVCALESECPEIDHIHLRHVEKAAQQTIKGIVLQNGKGQEPEIFYYFS